jgi:hypothetical protein
VTGEWVVEVTRTVRLSVPARSASEAREMALSLAWEWLPECAEGGDQGSATVRVVREGDLPGDGRAEAAAYQEQQERNDRA